MDMSNQTKPSGTPEKPADSTGKGRATPTRKEREAAQRKPLVAAAGTPLTPEQKKARRAENVAANAVRREGLMNGEEKYLGFRDRGPQKRLTRDIVDSRFTVGELMIPILILSLIVTSLPIEDKLMQVSVQGVVLLVMWALIIGMIVDGYFLGRAATKAIEAKFGKGKVERGIVVYAAMRGVNMRPLRLPKPQVARGGAPIVKK